MMDGTQQVEHMAAPTFVVGWKDFDALAYQRILVYEIHGRKGREIVPDIAQEIGENTVIFPTGPKEIIFRKRFTAKTVKRQVRHITADNSNRYDLVFTIYLKD